MALFSGLLAALLMILALFLLIFVVGLIFLIIGLVTKNKQNNLEKTKKYPKVLIGIGVTLMIVPAICVVAFFVNAAVKTGSSGSAGTEIHPNRYANEDDLFQDKVDEFFEAADNDDAEAIYNMFSETAKKENSSLKQQIQQFLKEYPHNPDTIENSGPSQTSSSYEYGKKSATLSNGFVFTKDGENYYCYLSYTSIDEMEPENEGIDYITVKSEKVYCDEDFDFSGDSGIYIQLTSYKNYDTRRIGGYPEIFTEYDRTITEEELRNFLAESISLSEFKEKFGEPNADDTNLVCFYELESEDGKPRYAKLYYHTNDDEIIDCSGIVDDKGDYYSALFEEE